MLLRIHFQHSACSEYSLELDGVGCSSISNIYLSDPTFFFPSRCARFSVSFINARCSRGSHAITGWAVITRLTGGGGQVSFLDAYVEQAGVTKGERPTWYPNGSIHPLHPLLAWIISDNRSLSRPMDWPNYQHCISTTREHFLTIVQLRNPAATRACMGGRISDDPGPSSSPSSSWHIVSDDSRVVFARAECAWMIQQTWLLIYLDSSEAPKVNLKG